MSNICDQKSSQRRDYKNHIPKQAAAKLWDIVCTTYSRTHVVIIMYVGMPRGTRGTRGTHSPGSPAVFQLPVPRGIKFNTLRFPMSPPLFPEVPKKDFFPVFLFFEK